MRYQLAFFLLVSLAFADTDRPCTKQTAKDCNTDGTVMVCNCVRESAYPGRFERFPEFSIDYFPVNSRHVKLPEIEPLAPKKTNS
jgi:hypothetical protein